MGVFLAYAGLALASIGLVSVAVPLKFLRIRTRRTGAAAASIGAVIALAGLLLPPPSLRRGKRPASRIDEFMPVFQFSEFHQRRIRAGHARVFESIRDVTAGEIPLFGFLTGIRNPGRFFEPQPDGILNPRAATPILEEARASGFFILAEEEPREIVLGTYLSVPSGASTPPSEDFLRLSAPGYVKATMNFRVETRPDDHCVLTTQTRVLATGPAAARRFAVYWRLIYPGSALIRRMWLLAIARRAERARPGPSS